MWTVIVTAALQATNPAAAARAHRAANEHAIIAEFRELLSIPNEGRDLPNIRRNAEWIRAAFGRRGVDTELFQVRGAPPVVFGEIATPGATRTVVFYVHYDGQPVVPIEWTSGEPYRPRLADAALDRGGKFIDFPRPSEAFDPEWRLYARSASDDKAPVLSILTALDALKAAGIRLKSHIKFFFEGEEELGSMRLRQILTKYRDRLDADLWLFCDGPVHQTRTQQVVFGVRGVTGLDLTVYGATRTLHSGHYGNWAPNPAWLLIQLLATMRDGAGNITVEGYYDDVRALGTAERRAIAAAPSVDDSLKVELGLARTEGDGERLEARISLPSLNVRGIASGSVGRTARNIVPSVARASIDMRLVAGMDWRKTQERVIAHIAKQGYHVLDRDPTDEERLEHPRIIKVLRRSGYNAVRSPLDRELPRRIVAALEAVHGSIVQLPTLGGSLPLATLEEVLGAPILIVPIANHDNNQHAPDENIRIANLWAGIETMAALLAL